MELCGIRADGEYSRKTANVVLMLAILNQYRGALECNVNRRVIKRVFSELNSIMEQELGNG
jgi:hypothetical protein